MDCLWIGFVDIEFFIKEYRIMMGNVKGDDFIYFGGLVFGYI